jgi:hypothetical protein
LRLAAIPARQTGVVTAKSVDRLELILGQGHARWLGSAPAVPSHAGPARSCRGGGGTPFRHHCSITPALPTTVVGRFRRSTDAAFAARSSGLGGHQH